MTIMWTGADWGLFFLAIIFLTFAWLSSFFLWTSEQKRTKLLYSFVLEQGLKQKYEEYLALKDIKKM